MHAINQQPTTNSASPLGSLKDEGQSALPGRTCLETALEILKWNAHYGDRYTRAATARLIAIDGEALRGCHSMTRCKLGDLAVIVRSAAGNEGKIVRCVRFLPQKKWVTRDGFEYEADSWEVDQALATALGHRVNATEDSKLRPIRDPGDDAVDAMVRIAGKPSTIPADLARIQEALTRLEAVIRYVETGDRGTLVDMLHGDAIPGQLE